jgi:HlyD family secretion protein
MSVTANIIIAEKENVLSVPSATIKTEGTGENIRIYVMKKVGTGSTQLVETTSSSTASSSRNFSGRKRTVAASDTENTKVYVTTGLSDDINTEILSGINEGDQVVSKTVTASTATAKTQTTFSLFGGGGRPGGATAGANTRATGGGNATFGR